jgi:hypothetical protein
MCSASSRRVVVYDGAVTRADLKVWESGLEEVLTRIRPLFYRRRPEPVLATTSNKARVAASRLLATAVWLYVAQLSSGHPVSWSSIHA